MVNMHPAQKRKMQIKTFHCETNQWGQFLRGLWRRLGWELQQQIQTRGDDALQWDNWYEKQPICPVGELTPQASAVCRLASGVTTAGPSSRLPGPLLFPGKQSPAEGGCSGSRGWSYTVKLDQGCTPTREKLAWLNCGGSKEQSLLL
jgi:hypothetical protein